MIKKVLPVVLGIACLAVLFFGHSYWKQQIAVSAKSSSNVTKEVTREKITNEKPDLLAYTKNWAETDANRFKQKIDKGSAFKILFVGSPAFGSIYEILKEKMAESYGKSIQLELLTSDLTSTQFIEDEKQEEVAAEQADIVVIEPFLLIDNGAVGIEESLSNLTTTIEAIKKSNPETTVMLQPSIPLFNAKFYPIQVDGLKVFAEENELTYLDHWSAWPDQKSEEIKEYLNANQTAPSEKGLQVWSDFLVQYFIQQ